ncbi:histidinol-phosphate transaminase [Paenibacillus contaminans]|uniref:Histidinol-phosphate aminotransferase n=1 Tax=Paenibacillus contaminans TaxID=450362 RepID=A0A329LU20_9BACL|nr:histidinol-phosphate transaminase [Paenibacillus contaminans]RAV11259.1 histidinol-phosphate transaminase [Paenibacillus contaminans]
MSLILPHIERMAAYEAGDYLEAGGEALKLNQNESPYPASPKVLEALRGITEEELRRYPDGRSGQLRSALASRFNVEESQVFCGNGSSEIIALLFKLMIAPDSRVEIPDPSFMLYHTAAAVNRIEVVPVPADEDFSIDLDRLGESGEQAIVLVNPHAPTGRLLPAEGIERLLQRFRGLVIVDEAYIDFAVPGASVLPLIGRYSNLVVVRTFSKSYALCGARVGFCVADAAVVAALDKGRDVFNINAVSQKLALAALEDEAYMQHTAEAVRRTRESFCRELAELGFDFIPSQTNFVLCGPPARSGALTARQLYDKLQESGIYVRYLKHPRLVDKLRISIGTDEEMERVLKELRRLTGQG